MGTHICSNMRPVAEFLDGFWVVIFSIYIYICHILYVNVMDMRFDFYT